MTMESGVINADVLMVLVCWLIRLLVYLFERCPDIYVLCPDTYVLIKKQQAIWKLVCK